VAYLQSSKFTDLLKEDQSSSELPKDIFKLIEKLQKGAKVAKGNPTSPELFALQITVEYQYKSHSKQQTIL
jgi:hypothetical protein